MPHRFGRIHVSSWIPSMLIWGRLVQLQDRAACRFTIGFCTCPQAFKRTIVAQNLSHDNPTARPALEPRLQLEAPVVSSPIHSRLRWRGREMVLSEQFLHLSIQLRRMTNSNNSRMSPATLRSPFLLLFPAVRERSYPEWVTCPTPSILHAPLKLSLTPCLTRQ